MSWDTWIPFRKTNIRWRARARARIHQGMIHVYNASSAGDWGLKPGNRSVSIRSGDICCLLWLLLDDHFWYLHSFYLPCSSGLMFSDHNLSPLLFVRTKTTKRFHLVTLYILRGALWDFFSAFFGVRNTEVRDYVLPVLFSLSGVFFCSW